MAVGLRRGKKQKYIAQKSFTLNWDDRNTRPIKVLEGQEVYYDGVVAVIDDGAEELKGRCIGLRSAINVMKWLVPYNGKGLEVDKESEKEIKSYDSLRGGDFDVYVNKNMAKPVTKSQIIKEEDLIVKELPSLRKTEKEKSNKLEVVKDQVGVKKIPDRLLVGSTTVKPRKVKKISNIVEADEMGSDTTIPIKNLRKSKNSEKRGYVVDDTVPRQVRDDATIEEVRKITKVIPVEDTQEAKVVGNTKELPVEKQSEGIILRKIKSPRDVSFNQITTPDGITVRTTVSAMKESASSQGIVVATSKMAQKDTNIIEEIPELTEEEKKAKAEKLDKAKKLAEQRAESRKKALAKTQNSVKEEKEVVESEKKLDDEKIQSGTSKKDISEIISTDYLFKLPDNWSKLHWVKKEKFIRDITDIEFVKFIDSIETVKAVKNACMERLKELEQEKSDKKNNS